MNEHSSGSGGKEVGGHEDHRDHQDQLTTGRLNHAGSALARDSSSGGLSQWVSIRRLALDIDQPRY